MTVSAEITTLTVFLMVAGVFYLIGRELIWSAYRTDWRGTFQNMGASFKQMAKGLVFVVLYLLLGALAIGVLSLVVWGWVALIAAGPVVVFLALIWGTLLFKD